jgi:GNAT superfamily N-acetyltransferase
MTMEMLAELALRPWGRPRVGIITDVTPERIVELWPSFPMQGPNHVGRIRCAPERVDPLVDEVRALARRHGLVCQWNLDPDARPADLEQRLAARGIAGDEELDVMLLPAAVAIDAPDGPIEIVDGLRDEATYAAAEQVQVAAFGGDLHPHQRERYAEARADAARHFFLALWEGEPAGAGWATVHPEGVLMNGGAVDPRFQGRGVYRALIAARQRLAREVGAPGVGVQANRETSGPVLTRLGFRTVGQWRLLEDRT